MKILLFPFAGGSSLAYGPIIKHFSGTYDLIPIELPGRGTRMREPLISDVDRLVEDLVDRYSSCTYEEYAIFGHSFGTLLGILFARQLQYVKNSVAPVRLFFSGRSAPSSSIESSIHLMADQEFINELKEMGGSQEEILSNKELMSFYLPILRNDFKAVETYKYQELAAVNLPITVMYAEDDPSTTPKGLALWRNETIGEVEMISFPYGGHFFIYKHSERIALCIEQRLSSGIASF